MKRNTKKSKNDEINENTLIFSSLLFICFVFIFASLPAFAQNFSRTFNVSSETSGLEVINQVGSIKVTTSDANKIVISAKQIDSRSQISATQNS
ncbi:MAG: hypothetical protein J2P41_23190, partial [Blastocatellia bacterium]|nr:hypothetical protein [Blastocatellia bacterium]